MEQRLDDIDVTAGAVIVEASNIRSTDIWLIKRSRGLLRESVSIQHSDTRPLIHHPRTFLRNLRSPRISLTVRSMAFSHPELCNFVPHWNRWWFIRMLFNSAFGSGYNVTWRVPSFQNFCLTVYVTACRTHDATNVPLLSPIFWYEICSLN